MDLKIVIVVCLAATLQLEAYMMGRECKDCNAYCSCLPAVNVPDAELRDFRAYRQCEQEFHKKQREAMRKREEDMLKNPASGMRVDHIKRRKEFETCMKNEGFDLKKQRQPPKPMCPSCQKTVDLPPFFGRKKRSVEKYLQRAQRAARPSGGLTLVGPVPRRNNAFAKAMNDCLAKKNLPKRDDPKWQKTRQTVNRAMSGRFKEQRKCFNDHCETNKQAKASFKCSEKHFNVPAGGGPMPMPHPIG